MATRGTMEACFPNECEASKMKVEQKRKSELISEIRRLNIQIQAIERERATHIFSKRSDFRKDFASLEEIEAKLLEERNEDYLQMCQQLSRMSHMVKGFRKELTSIKPTPEFVEKLKRVMEEIERSINSFKDEQKCKYEELLREERATYQELNALERKFLAWSEMCEHQTIQYYMLLSTNKI
ncbi:hypothetical protein C0Q70_20741 [Pomacea canaliculata]|uniref:Uncharacterized protein n=1 Tax=Pomacea canaliculata TaxID=400727 RepID=A0A2T7NGG6_POMCA|nr:hypothetical protein C0Q70_20741 [Pomacea canaliculata]